MRRTVLKRIGQRIFMAVGFAALLASMPGVSVENLKLIIFATFGGGLVGVLVLYLSNGISNLRARARAKELIPRREGE